MITLENVQNVKKCEHCKRKHVINRRNKNEVKSTLKYVNCE